MTACNPRYQQVHNLYSPVGNGMKAYFGLVRDKFFQVFYDNLVQRFRSVSRAYDENVKVNEWTIYGSARLGVHKTRLELVHIKFYADTTGGSFINRNDVLTVDAAAEVQLYTQWRGQKRYELTNHLGNVMTVISDKKRYECSGSYYVAEVIQATDYSAFGAPMPDRVWTSSYVLHTQFKGSYTGGWTAYSGSPTISAAADKLAVTASGTATIQKTVTVDPGSEYDLVLDIDTGGFKNLKVEVREGATAATPYQLIHSYTTTVNGRQVLHFRATWPDMLIRVIAQTSAGGGSKTAYLDYVYLVRSSGKKYVKYGTAPKFLSVNNRSGGIPKEYIAGDSIIFDDGFESGTADEFETMIERMISVNNGLDEDDYRFGFQGQEMDNEVYGEGNAYTAEYWEYDSRLGRRWNRDHVVRAWEGTYVAFHNNPIVFDDPLGLDPPKRLNIFQRFDNWIRGNGFKNEANKFAVNNKIDESNVSQSRDKNGNRIMTVKWASVEKLYDTEGHEIGLDVTYGEKTFKAGGEERSDNNSAASAPFKMAGLGFDFVTKASASVRVGGNANVTNTTRLYGKYENDVQGANYTSVSGNIGISPKIGASTGIENYGYLFLSNKNTLTSTLYKPKLTVTTSIQVGLVKINYKVSMNLDGSDETWELKMGLTTKGTLDVSKQGGIETRVLQSNTEAK